MRPECSKGVPVLPCAGLADPWTPGFEPGTLGAGVECTTLSTKRIPSPRVWGPAAATVEE